jgi:hypothetical protein
MLTGMYMFGVGVPKDTRVAVKWADISEGAFMPLHAFINPPPRD